MDRELQTNLYVVSLLRSALTGEKPPEKPENVAWRDVFQTAKKHSVSCLALHAAKDLQALPEPEVLSEWQQFYVKNVIAAEKKVVSYDELRQALLAGGFRFMPLKGWILRAYYPLPELREMCDIDILIDSGEIERLTALMQSQGFRLKEIITYHYGFEKPYLSVELHTGLMPPEYHYYNYYKNPWRLPKQVGDTSEYRFSDEDYYVFMLAHFAKHYFSSGGGIRYITDLAVFLRRRGQTLDWTFVQKQLKKLKLVKFDRTARALADAWFGGKPLDAEAEEMQRYLFHGCTYGSLENFEEGELRRQLQNTDSLLLAKTRVFLSKAFLPYRHMCGIYPVLRRVPVLLPACWLHRFLRILFTKPKNILRRVRQAKNTRLSK